MSSNSLIEGILEDVRLVIIRYLGHRSWLVMRKVSQQFYRVCSPLTIDRAFFIRRVETLKSLIVLTKTDRYNTKVKEFVIDTLIFNDTVYKYEGRLRT